MDTSFRLPHIFRRAIALPQEHGSWVFLLLPLIAGLVLGQASGIAPVVLSMAALTAFLLRQPVTVLVKIASKRRGLAELSATLFWIAIYGSLVLGFALWLALNGYLFVLYLAVPAMPVFAWHLWLVSRRAERRKPGIEIVGAGVLALAAPSAYWVAQKDYDATGWLLWALFWLQGAASIVYAYLQLEQREWDQVPMLAARLRAGWRSLAYTGFNLLLAAALARAGVVSGLLPLAFLVQFIEAVWGTLNPAIGAKPAHIGVRQTIISAVFGMLFIVFW